MRIYNNLLNFWKSFWKEDKYTGIKKQKKHNFNSEDLLKEVD